MKLLAVIAFTFSIAAVQAQDCLALVKGFPACPKGRLDAIAESQFGCRTSGGPPDLKCLCSKNDQIKLAAMKDAQIKTCGDAVIAKALSVSSEVCACVAKAG